MSTDTHAIDAAIAARVRGLRLERGLTLDGLAAAAGVSRAMLSRVERAESSPTAQFLARVCDGLGVTLAALFAAPPAADGALARRATQPSWRDPASGYLRRTLSPAAAGGGTRVTEVELPPGAAVGFDNSGGPRAEQQVWLLAGTLELTAGDTVYRMEEGDCLWMRLDQPTGFRNPSDQPARYAVILTLGSAR